MSETLTFYLKMKLKKNLNKNMLENMLYYCVKNKHNKSVKKQMRLESMTTYKWYAQLLHIVAPRHSTDAPIRLTCVRVPPVHRVAFSI